MIVNQLTRPCRSLPAALAACAVKAPQDPVLLKLYDRLSTAEKLAYFEVADSFAAKHG